jgi:hypothetical protein
MSDTQKFQLVKAKQDALMDLAGLAVFAAITYFVLNPTAYDRVTMAVNDKLNRVSHWIGVWQTRLSIRSLPETDGS